MKVWVTRDEDRLGPLSSALIAVGLEVILEPVVQRRLISDAADEIARLGRDDWLVLTSVYAIRAVAAQPARVPRVAVVGQASREAALARGFRVEFVSDLGSGQSLFRGLRAVVQGGRVCYPRSHQAPSPQPWPEVELTSPILYETIPRPFERRVAKQADIVSVVSPSAVAAVGAFDLRYASIGPSTSEAIGRIGRTLWVESPQPDFTSLANAIADQC